VGTVDPHAVARALGGAASGRKISAPGPGHGPGDRSLSVTLDPDAPEGFVAHSFAGDPWEACRDHVKAALGLPAFTSTRMVRRSLVRPNDRDRTAFPRAIWAQGGDLRGTLAEKYLNGRGLNFDPELAGALRFHPRCPFGKGGVVVPALVAAFHPVRVSCDQPPTAIHRTGLTWAGDKIDKMMLGPVRECAVKLDPDDAVTFGLGICEGIETGLAIRATGWRPIWALGSAGAVRTFPVLAGIDALTIFADNDEKGTGQGAARECASRWVTAGREVFIRTPSNVGSDWLDVRP